MSVQVFSTDAAPAAQRAQLFRQQMQERFSIGLMVESSDGGPFSTQVTAYCGRTLQFASLRFSPHRTYSASARSSMAPRLVLTLQDEGIAEIKQDGRQAYVTPGDFCLIDPARPFGIDTTQIRTRSVYLDRNSLLTTLPYSEALTARAINGKTGPGAMLRSMLGEMFQIASALDEDTADSIAASLPYVLAIALHGVNKELAPHGSRLKLFHKQRILRFVRNGLRDPWLDAQSIARGVNLSARYVYDLFSDEDQPLMKWVWCERLERCRRDFEDKSLLGRSISEIAYSWGFSDMAHFSRAFRLRFKMAPREFRKSSDRSLAA